MSDDNAHWKRQVLEISDWLYERDPAGASGGGTSPKDEYDGEAVRILSGLQTAATPGHCKQVVRDVFDKAFDTPWTPSRKDAKWLLTFSRSNVE